VKFLLQKVKQQVTATVNSALPNMV
jgi:hypothetical protein